MSQAIPKELRRRKGNPLEMLIVTVLAIAAMIWGITWISTGEPLWFVGSEFDARPLQIVIWNEGEQRVLQPGEPEYETLVEQVNAQLNDPQGYYETSPRPQVVEEMKESSIVAYFIYARTLDLRGRWNLGEPNQIWLPVTGSYSSNNVLFTGSNGRFGHGGLVVPDLAPIRALIRTYAATP